MRGGQRGLAGRELPGRDAQAAPPVHQADAAPPPVWFRAGPPVRLGCSPGTPGLRGGAAPRTEGAPVKTPVATKAATPVCRGVENLIAVPGGIIWSDYIRGSGHWAGTGL